MKKTTLLVLAMLTLVSSTLCQEPTYEQTQKWVVFKIREGGGAKITYSGGDYMTESYPEASMDDCRLRWTTVLFGSGLRIVGKGASVTNTTDSIGESLGISHWC